MSRLETKYPTIPEPTQDVAALLKTVQALKMSLEIVTGQRSPNVKGLDSQLVDLRSQAEGREARFTQFTETSTSNQQALAQRTTTLEAEVGSNTAKITEVEKAYADADKVIVQSVSTLEGRVGSTEGSIQNLNSVVIDGPNALVSRVDTLEASDDNGFAGGELSFVASAGPAGYSASYDLKLRANNAYSGFSVLAKDNGGGNYTSEIVLTASSFRLQDPNFGSAPVFSYMAGAFQFNVPVRLLKNDLGVGSASQVFPRIVTNIIVTPPTTAGNDQGIRTIDAASQTFTVSGPASLFVSVYMSTLLSIVTASSASPTDARVTVSLYVDGNRVSYQNPVHDNYSGLAVAPANVLKEMDYLKFLILQAGTHTVELRFTFVSAKADTVLRFVSIGHDIIILDR